MRTMFVVVTVFCIWLGWQHRIVQQRREMVTWIEQHGGNTANSRRALAWTTAGSCPCAPNHCWGKRIGLCDAKFCNSLLLESVYR